MPSHDTRPLCACGCGVPAHRDSRFARGQRPCSGTLEQKLWARVEKSDGCWLWTGIVERDKGYGRYRHEGVWFKAHRLSWEVNVGPIPSSLEVCHRCDNPPCVRPDHLFLGTHTDNMQDASRKGRMSRGGAGDRQARGERAGTAKLRDADIPVIRGLHAQGLSTRKISQRFGVAHHQIRRILNGVGWTHIV